VTLPSPPPSLRVQICGALTIERDGQRLEGLLPGRQGRLLFTYLVVNRHRPVTRDEVAEALWHEPDQAAVEARLNPLLSKLRRVFGADAVDGRSTLRLCLTAAWVDLEAAAEAIHRAESAREHNSRPCPNGSGRDRVGAGRRRGARGPPMAAGAPG
jgi:SARP family transcriptional regulator, regulator of embCAB operon